MPRAIIVGAGIGGLTAAIALKRTGWDVSVHERAPELHEVGAGITLWTNAVKVLRKLDVGKAIEEVAAAEAKANFNTNVFGTLSVIQAALPLLRAQHSGHILTVSSIGGVIGFPTGGIYVATKFAVEGMSEALAGEVASFGIKVSIIEPGSFATGFRSSIKAAPAMAEYEAVRQAVFSAFKPEMAGDPLATAAAILKVIDADKPPLRLLLGTGPLPMIKKLYEGRLATWDQWVKVSNAAQGDRAA